MKVINYLSVLFQPKYRLVFVTLFLLSCQKEVPIKIGESDRKIVVNSVFSEGELFSAQVYRSNLVTDRIQTGLYLNNATVEVFSNNELIDVLPLVENGYFQSTDKRAEAGTIYTIQVSVPNLNTVTSSEQLLQPVPIVSFDSVGTVIDEYGYNTYLMKLTFQDPETEKNYYRLSIAALSFYFNYDSLYQPVEDTTWVLQPIYIESNDPVVEANDNGILYFSDLLFNGKNYEFEFTTYYYTNSKYLYAILENVSYDYYRYSVSLPAHSEAEDLKFFMEAVLVYNNIENGLGIFGSTAASEDSLYNSNFGKTINTSY